MYQPDPKARPRMSELIQMGTISGGYFDNAFIRTALFLENITVKENAEKIQFFK
jgi:hypothetical protein